MKMPALFKTMIKHISIIACCLLLLVSSTNVNLRNVVAQDEELTQTQEQDVQGSVNEEVEENNNLLNEEEKGELISNESNQSTEEIETVSNEMSQTTQEKEEVVSNEESQTSEEVETLSSEENEIVEETNVEENIEAVVEVNYPSFNESKVIDNITITVSAAEGVFPEGSYLYIEKVDNDTLKQVDDVINEQRNKDANVVSSYTFDIKVFDKDNNEVQPSDNNSVKVSFKLQEVENNNLEAQVYHVSDTDLSVEQLNVENDNDTLVVETESFSYYTVEFTYNNLQYVLQGDESIELNTVLGTLGLSGEVSSVTVSNKTLFDVVNENGKWIVHSYKAFTSTEWMKVTINDVEYEIVVTDAIPGDDVTDREDMDAGQTKTGNFTITGGPVRGPLSGTATIKDGTITNNASNTAKGGYDSSKGSALIARGANSLSLQNVTINSTTNNLVLNIWANSSINADNVTLNGSANTSNDTPFLMVGAYPNGGKGTLNFSGNSTISGAKGSVVGGNNNSEINVNSGTLTITDSSDIKLNNGIKINVNSGATLKLYGDSKITGSTINVKSGGILDISDSDVYTIDNLPNNVSLEANAIIKVKEYPINEVIVNNSESATIDSEGNITKNPPYGDQTKTVQGKSVKIRADEYKISETAPITVNNGGKLYFDNVNLDDKHAITINNGGKAYLKGTNTFGSEDKQVTIANAGQILVDPDETSAEIANSNLKMTGTGNITVEGNKTLTIKSSEMEPVGNQQIFVEAKGTLTTDDQTDVDLSGCNVRYIVLRDQGKLNVTDSTFKNSPKLGVIRANGSNTINIKGSTFENNIANGGAYPQEFGGVLVVEQASDVTIIDSKFNNNQASKNGGAIYQNGGTLTISGNSEFNDNTAMTINGGAVYFVGGESEKDKLTIYGVSFTGNKAEKGYGGAVYSKAPTEIKDANFEDNTAKRGGGVYICNGKDSVVDGATFTNNTAIDSDNGGGAIAVGIDGSNNGADSFTVNKSTFKDNTAKDGGSIAVKDTKKLTIDDESTFEGNNAQRGGAIYINGVSDATIGKATFTMNGLREGQDYGAQDAGAIFIESAAGETNVTLNGTKFEENVVYGPASSSGGAIYVRAGSGAYKFADCKLFVNGAKFTDNTAGLYGGAMTVAHSAHAYISDLDGDPTEFIGNAVLFATDHAGGGLFINQGYVHMDDVAIYNNYAKSGGGGISSCTKGAAEAKVLGGAAIFDNHVGSDGADPEMDDYALIRPDIESYPDIFFETKDHINRGTGDPITEWENWPIELYERMFNGGLHKWDAKPFDGVKIHDTLLVNSFMAKSNPTNKDISKAKVIFTENIATSPESNIATGGAIGCNGLLEMGTGTEIKIVKVWDDARNNDGYRPDLDESFLDNLIVKGNGKEVDIKSKPIITEIVNIKDFDPAVLANNIINMQDPQKDLSAYDAWVIVISGLDLTDDDGNTINYTIEEKDQEYYSLIENIGGNDTFFEMKNKHNIDLVNISVSKVWYDSNNQHGTRPASITVRLYADGKEIDKANATPSSDWKVNFNDLPRYKDGKEITYTVSEDSVYGYSSRVQLVSSIQKTDKPDTTNNETVDEELDNDKIEELDQPIATPHVEQVEQIVVEKEFVITNIENEKPKYQVPKTGIE